MEEKRRFCDLMDKINGNKILYNLIHLLLICFCFAICMFFYTFIFEQSYSDIIYEYSEEKYKHYKELAKKTENAVQEGKEIDLSAIPENITYTIEKTSENITTFKFKYIENGEFSKTIINGQIILSSDYKIIEREVKVLSPKEYIDKSEEDSIGLAIVWSLVTTGCICFISKKILKRLYDKSFKEEKIWKRFHQE